MRHTPTIAFVIGLFVVSAGVGLLLERLADAEARVEYRTRLQKEAEADVESFVEQLQICEAYSDLDAVLDEMEREEWSRK